jgi:hypothetical protein
MCFEWWQVTQSVMISAFFWGQNFFLLFFPHQKIGKMYCFSTNFANLLEKNSKFLLSILIKTKPYWWCSAKSCLQCFSILFISTCKNKIEFISQTTTLVYYGPKLFQGLKLTLSETQMHTNWCRLASHSKSWYLLCYAFSMLKKTCKTVPKQNASAGGNT